MTPLRLRIILRFHVFTGARFAAAQMLPPPLQGCVHRSMLLRREVA